MLLLSFNTDLPWVSVGVPGYLLLFSCLNISYDRNQCQNPKTALQPLLLLKLFQSQLPRKRNDSLNKRLLEAKREYIIPFLSEFLRFLAFHHPNGENIPWLKEVIIESKIETEEADLIER